MLRAYLYQTPEGAVLKELRAYGAATPQDYARLVGVRIHDRERYDLSADPAEGRNLFDAVPLPSEMARGIEHWEGRWSLLTPAGPKPSALQLERLRALGYVR